MNGLGYRRLYRFQRPPAIKAGCVAFFFNFNGFPDNFNHGSRNTALRKLEKYESSN